MKDDDAHECAEKDTGQVEYAVEAYGKMLKCVKAHHPGKEDGEGFDEDQTVLAGLHSHRVRCSRNNDQKPDQGIDQEDLHNGALIHRFFLADFTASLKKTIYQCQKDPDHRYSPCLISRRKRR